MSLRENNRTGKLWVLAGAWRREMEKRKKQAVPFAMDLVNSHKAEGVVEQKNSKKPRASVSKTCPGFDQYSKEKVEEKGKLCCCSK